MYRTFSYTLLITWVFMAFACKSTLVPAGHKMQNINVSEDVNRLDSQIVNIYLPFKAVLEKDMQRVISVSNKEMVKSRPEGILNNFLADLILEETVLNCAQLSYEFVPDFTLVNYGSIRAPIPKGDVLVRNIFELMPFENEIVYLKLSGDVVLELINFMVKEKENAFAGMRLKVKNGQPSEIEIGNQLFDENKFYWLAVSDYLAEGGDNFKMLKKRLEHKKSGLKFRDAIISNLEKKYQKEQEINVELDGRFTYE